MFSLGRITSTSRHLVNTTCSVTGTVRQAHTYSRQDRGLYGGTQKQYGNSVSDSHRKTQRVWLPNVHAHTIYSKELGRTIKLRMTANVWRTIHNARYGGSIDAYLTSKSKDVQRNLGARGEQLRNEIMNRIRFREREATIHASIETLEDPVAAPEQAENVQAESVSADDKQAGEETAALDSDKVVSTEAKEAAKSEGAATGM